MLSVMNHDYLHLLFEQGISNELWPAFKYQFLSLPCVTKLSTQPHNAGLLLRENIDRTKLDFLDIFKVTDLLIYQGFLVILLRLLTMLSVDS